MAKKLHASIRNCIADSFWDIRWGKDDERPARLRERERDRPTDLALSSPLLVPPFLFKKKLTFFPRLSRRQGFIFFCNPSPPPRRLAGGWSSKNPLLPSSSWTSLNVFFSYGGENFFGLFLAPSRLLFSFFQQCAILCFLSLASKIGLIWRKRWENDAPDLYIYIPFPISH